VATWLRSKYTWAQSLLFSYYWRRRSTQAPWQGPPTTRA
jgi:hypothetical protein